MTVFDAHQDNSDLNPFAVFNKKLLPSGGSGTLILGLSPSETTSNGWFTEPGVPKSDAWENTNHTFHVVLTSTNMSITGRARLQRYNSAGVLQESGAFTSSQTMNGSPRDFVCAAPAGGWGSGGSALDCGDRLGVELQLTNTDSMSEQSITFSHLDSTHTSPIIENTASCVSGFTHSQGIIIA